MSDQAQVRVVGQEITEKWPCVGTQRIYDAGFDARFSAENRVYITGDKIVPIKHGMTEQQKQALLARIRN